MDTSQFRNGLKIILDGEPFTITYFQHVKPGKGGAFVRTKVRNLRTGRTLDRRFRSGEKVEEADIEDRKMQYLYKDGEQLVFMDTQTYDQMPFTSEQVGEDRKYLKENLDINVLFWNGKPINIELPNFIEAAIKQCEPGEKGDTASTVTKSATLETGAVVQVGTWQRSDHRFRLACEMVRGGRLGKLRKVTVVLGKNKTGGPFPPGRVETGKVDDRQGRRVDGVNLLDGLAGLTGGLLPSHSGQY